MLVAIHAGIPNQAHGNSSGIAVGNSGGKDINRRLVRFGHCRGTHIRLQTSVRYVERFDDNLEISLHVFGILQARTRQSRIQRDVSVNVNSTQRCPRACPAPSENSAHFCSAYTHGDHGAAVRVRVPCLLVHLQRSLRRDHANERWHLGRQVVDLVRVLAGTVFAAQQRVVGERLILQHLDALAAARLILRCLGHRVQLRYLVLKTAVDQYSRKTQITIAMWWFLVRLCAPLFVRLFVLYHLAQ